MTIYKFKVWCENAVSGIVFPPDREQVYGELLNHMYDHYDDLVEQGMDKEAAQQMALEAMGDAMEIAPQLAAIHRPFWGYFLRATRVVLVLTLCATLLCLGLWIHRTSYHTESNGFDPYGTSTSTRQDATRTRLYFDEPNQVLHSDGYTLTLTRAAMWQTTYDDPAREPSVTFYLEIEVFNPRPWAQHDDISRWFWAVDSLGNTYDAFLRSIANYAPSISANSYHTAPLTYTHEMWIGDCVSQEAEWIEFRYDRSGRHLVFRLDLTGGDAA